MVYTYNQETKQTTPVSMPKLKGEDAKRIEETSTPSAFIEKMMSMKLNTIQE